MIPQTVSTPPFSLSSLPLKPSLISLLKPTNPDRRLHQVKRKLRNVRCRAEFSTDTPIGVAIGACILNSLVFPIPSSPEEDDDDEGDSVIDSADARFAVMGIISFIPYFNWLSWLFAWLDTGKRRYAVYAIVYLAPYLRPNLSISPEDSWLPIASIVLCIIHIQLEASIKNGDIQGFQFFGEAGKHLSSNARKETEERRKDDRHLPSAQERTRNYIRNWGVPKKPFEDSKRLHEEDGEANDGKKH